jgi:hypothetical protein
MIWALTVGLMLGETAWGEPGAVAIASQLPSSQRQTEKILRVTSTADAGIGSLRWAITQANAAADDDLIDLGQVQGVISLQSPLPAITHSLTIMGDGDDTLSGAGQHRVLQIDGGDVVLRSITLADGLAQGAEGRDGAGGSAGMGGGLLINRGTVRLSHVTLVDNQAIGGRSHPPRPPAAPAQIQLNSQDNRLKVNRGAILDVEGVSLSVTDIQASLPITADISRTHEKLQANRGAVAGVSGIGINGIGSIVFGGGGGFGGFGNAGNGGNGGNGGADGGNGGNGGNGGVGIFGSFARWQDQGSLGSIAFGGGGGFGGFGNAGNGGNGGNAVVAIAQGGDGGDGGNGGFGGGGGAGGYGGSGGAAKSAGKPGQPGRGGFGGGAGGLGYGGSGAGLGGAVFIRSGHLILNQVQFIRNAAIAGSGPSPGQGKGGALFRMPSQATGQVAGQTAIASVLALGEPPVFIDNIASDAAGLSTDNQDVYGIMAYQP